MPPDDLPIDQAVEDSTKFPVTKTLIPKDGGSPVAAEDEVRGGAKQADDEPPIEQQQRRDRAKP